jgi:hypothetical protein
MAAAAAAVAAAAPLALALGPPALLESSCTGPVYFTAVWFWSRSGGETVDWMLSVELRV